MTARIDGRWDPLVRLTHWGVAAGILANALLTEEGSGLHQTVGYGVAGLLALRWIWGFFGPKPARFSSFPPSPGRALAHIRDIAAGRKTTHRSHNPFGALMVYALWGTMAVVIATGIGMTLSPKPAEAAPALESTAAPRQEQVKPAREEAGESEDDESEGEEAEGGEGEGPLGEIHEAAANLLLVLAGLHLAGVAFETRRSGRKIVTAMIVGPSRDAKQP